MEKKKKKKKPNFLASKNIRWPSGIATDKALFYPKNADIFLISRRKHVVGTH